MPKEAPVKTSRRQPSSIRGVIGVKLLPREVAGEYHPGHMGVTWKRDGKRHFRGFRFNVLDLPEGVRLPSMWRSHLFEHRVPGHVHDDLMLRDAVAQHGPKVLCKEWPASDEQMTQLETQTRPGRSGWYSFAPDRHLDCNNCVTWAIRAVNNVLGGVLPSLSSGRIKMAIEMLLERGAEPSA